MDMHRLVLIFMFLVFFSGCTSVFQSDSALKDLSLLKEDTSRKKLITEFGEPVWSNKKEGRRSDIFSFTQEFTKSEKFQKGMLGFVGIEAGGYEDGTPVKVLVKYDSEDKVSEIRSLQGSEVLEASGGSLKD